MKNKTYIVNGIEKDIVPNYAHLQKWNRMGFLFLMLPFVVMFGAIVISYHSQATDLLWWILPGPLAVMCFGILYAIRLVHFVNCVNCGKVIDKVVRNERNETLLFYCKHCDTLNDAMVSRKGD
ncbi:MAG TPA: hypothetical protein DCM28_22690 [Phycisphaerales bacterium]|nr:hypothetical protein [Phycisphaerales bacterium]HCD33083.1 hypothetical protein [Phycisphaerales bacterium]|tara:strand:+ start:111 stop:479 length:369 start_codon:yes stop_codon:yes gene_type:complete